MILGAIQGLYVSVRADQQRERGLHSRRSVSAALDLKLGGSFNGIAEPIGSAIVSGIVVAFMRLLVNDEERGFETLLAGDVRAALAGGRQGSCSRSVLLAAAGHHR